MPVPDEIVEAVATDELALKTIKYRHPYWWGRALQAIRLIPRDKVIYLKPACVVTMIRIAGLFASLPKMPSDASKRMERIHALINSELPKIVEALAVAIHNGKGNPPDWLVDAIRYQFTQEELALSIYHVHRRLGVEAFFVIMGFAQNLAATDMLATEAHGQQSEESSSTMD